MPTSLITEINGLPLSASQATSASYAATASLLIGSVTSASYAATASLLLGSVISASNATTASYALTAQTLLGSVVSASYAATASLLLGSVTSASYAATASYSPTLGASLKNTSNLLALQSSDGTSLTTLSSLALSSFTGSLSGSALSSVTASYALTAQTLLGSVVSASYAATASYVLQAISSSYSTLAQTSNTASYYGGSVVSASYATTASVVVGAISTASYALTASYVSPTFISASAAASGFGSGGSSSPAFPYTGSAKITGSLTVTGSTILSGSLIQVIGNTYFNGDGLSAATNTNLYLESPEITLGQSGNVALRTTNTAGAIVAAIGDVDGNFNGTNVIVNDTAGTVSVNSVSVFDLYGRFTTPQITASIGIQGTASYATQALSASWAPSSGGGGTPGGSTTQVQYNDAGAFAGDAGLTWDNISGSLNISGSYPSINLGIVTTDPSTPAANTMEFYAKKIAGRLVPKIKGPSGLDYPLQASFWSNEIFMWNQTNLTAGLWIGTVGAGAGTFANTLPSTNGLSTLYQSIKRARYANVVTTTNQVLGQRNSEAIFYRGAATNQGGFFFYARCGFDTWTNGGRFFAGMATATTVISADPSSLNNTVGFCVDAADNGAISFLTRNTATATKTSTGLTITSGKGYDIYIFNPSNSDTYSWRIVDINTGTEASGTTNTTPPSAGTGLTANVLASNAALTPVNSIQIGVIKIYIEVDY